MGDLTWLPALGQSSPWIVVVGVLLFGWRRDAKRADRLEQGLHTALRAVDQFAANMTTVIESNKAIASAVNEWGITAGRHRQQDGSGD